MATHPAPAAALTMDWPEPATVDEVLAWLRRPGGGLQDRMMRSRAADLIEAAHGSPSRHHRPGPRPNPRPRPDHPMA